MSDTPSKPPLRRPPPLSPAVRPRPIPPTPVMFTVTDCARRLGVSKMTVYRLIHAGELEALRIGRSFRVTERMLNDYYTQARTGKTA